MEDFLVFYIIFLTIQIFLLVFVGLGFIVLLCLGVLTITDRICFPLCHIWLTHKLQHKVGVQLGGVRLFLATSTMLIRPFKSQESLPFVAALEKCLRSRVMATKMIFMKLWVFYICSEQSTWNKFTCKTFPLTVSVFKTTEIWGFEVQISPY